MDRDGECRCARQLGEAIAQDATDVARARRVREGIAHVGAQLAVAVGQRRTCSGLAAREALGQCLLELGAPRVQALFVTLTATLRERCLVGVALLLTLFETVLPLDEHLLEALGETIDTRRALLD